MAWNTPVANPRAPKRKKAVTPLQGVKVRLLSKTEGEGERQREGGTDDEIYTKRDTEGND